MIKLIVLALTLSLCVNAKEASGWYKIATLDGNYISECQHVDGSDPQSAISLTKNLKDSHIDQKKDSKGKLIFISTEGVNPMGQRITRKYFREQSECQKFLKENSVSPDDYK